MMFDMARPLTLLLSILSLYRVFHAAFLTTATSIAERGHDALLRLILAAVIALIAGLLFRKTASERGLQQSTSLPLARTLPIQLFCWATTGMAALFAASWYIETYCILYRDVRY